MSASQPRRSTPKRALAVEITSTRGAASRLGIEAAGEPGGFLLRGGLSMGSTGWTLKAGAARQRHTVTVSLTAHQAPESPRKTVEDHEYAIAVQGLAAGVYRVRLCYAFLLRDASAVGPPLIVWEGKVTVR